MTAVLPTHVANPEGATYRARVVYAAARTVARPVLRAWPICAPGLVAASALDLAMRFTPKPRYASVEPVEFDGFRGEWVRSGEPDEDSPILYFHGGAFVFCGLNTHRRGVARLAEATGRPVLSVGYRQLPSAPISRSIADCLEAYELLLDAGHDPDRIVLAGDSAGGYLVFAVALAAREAGLPLPGGLVALSPLLDFYSQDVLTHPNLRRDAYLPGARIARLADAFAAGGEPLDPASVPLQQDVEGLPPSMIVVAASEVLRVDAESMAARLTASGVPCTLRVWRGQVHAFPVLGNLVPESRAAIADIASFVRTL
ncbi:alpha/beta hydrolase [Solicola gregarius]|uniref:Alpha/beta hydrolase n=1 Tax=Solicola gregarius TaxID=2908642 RepID=A0AA46TJY5_9ACTN|nr:alpha/beta hydrolase [Solicola gregarius]UYM06655.1 alpha/beta hydrolase [Solicola gregarius]